MNCITLEYEKGKNMPGKKYSVCLSDAETAGLRRHIKEGRRVHCKESLVRAKVLLALDEANGHEPMPIVEIAKKYRISENSIRRIRKRYATNHLANTLYHNYHPLKKHHNAIVTIKILQRIIYYHLNKYPAETIAQRLISEGYLESVSAETVRRHISNIKKQRDFYDILKLLYHQKRYDEVDNLLVLPDIMKAMLYRDERFKDYVTCIPQDYYYRCIVKLYNDPFFHSKGQFRYLLDKSSYINWSHQLWTKESTHPEKNITELLFEELVGITSP